MVDSELLNNKARVLHSISNNLKGAVVEGYKPGNKKLYQLILEYPDGKFELVPKHQHLEGKEMYWYLEGLMDAIEMIRKDIL